MDRYIMPQRVVAEQNVKFSDNILVERPLQASFNDEGCIRIAKKGYIILDFGRELSGGIAFTVQRISKMNESAKLRIVFGESVSEAMSDIGVKNSTNDHSARDFIVETENFSTYRYGSTGFRFVKLEALDADLLIKSVKAESDIKDVKQIAEFKSSDELLNKIWDTGVYTVKLNMHDFIWDGLKRDRLVWIGDMHPEVSVVRTVFGRDKRVEKSLDFIRDLTPKDKWMNGIASYSFWWIIIHYDWFMHWGDRLYLLQQLDYLKELCVHICKWLDSGMSSEYHMTTFVDWDIKNTDNEKVGVKALACIALECAENIFSVLGEEKYAVMCREKRMFLRSEAIEQKLSRGISALTLLADCNSTSAVNTVSGGDVEDISAFMGYYILMAKAKLGQYDGALEIIRKYWGGMLEMGATSFWENFDVKWMENSYRIDELPVPGKKDVHGDFGCHCYKGFRKSLCHGWAAGPVPFLMEQIGGVKILEPGCKIVSVAPNTGSLENVEMKYPTPFGEIEMKTHRINGKLLTKVSAPKEVTVIENN